MMGCKNRQTSLFFGYWHDLIPEDHFLRQVDKVLDFSFVREKVAHLYSDTGRPSIDPEVLLRILLVGYFYNITSERELMEQIQVNLAFREFIGYELGEEIPDHSTLSKNRHGRFNGTPVFREMFDEVVRQCIDAGLVAGRHLSFDGTVIQANASYDSMVPKRVVEMSPTEYIQKVEEENPVAAEAGEKEECKPDQNRDAQHKETSAVVGQSPEGYSPKRTRKRKGREMKTNATHISRTDPDAKIFARPGQPKKLGYIECVTVDSFANIITAVEVIPGNADEAKVLVPMVAAQMFKFGLRPESLSGDKAHGEASVYKGLLALGIKPFIPHKDFHEQNSKIWAQEKFRYDPANDCYICPNNKVLRYQGYIDRGIMKTYRANVKDCQTCPYRSQCTTSTKVGRTIKRHIDAAVFAYVDRLLRRPEAYRARNSIRGGKGTARAQGGQVQGD